MGRKKSEEKLENIDLKKRCDQVGKEEWEGVKGKVGKEVEKIRGKSVVQ